MLDLDAARAPAFRGVSTRLNDVHLTADGSLLAGSKMGRVIWRKAGEKVIRKLQVDTWLEILSVRAYRNGLLVAGEEGLLRYSDNEGKTWKALVAPTPGIVAAIEPTSDGKLLALIQRGKQWSVHVSDDPMAGGWRELASFERILLSLRGGDPLAVAGSGRVGAMMTNGEFFVVDGTTEKLERHSSGAGVAYVQWLGDGTLIARAESRRGSSVRSTDGGRHWVELNTYNDTVAVTAADAQVFYAVAPNAPGLVIGAKMALMVSRDGTKTWSQSGSVPGGSPFDVRNLLFDHTDSSLLAILSDGRVMRSTDEGQTWSQLL